MPSVAQLVDALAVVTGERQARVNMMARRLIDEGLMPKSSGRDIAQVDAASVANLIFAVAFAEKAADAARTAREWGDLEWLPDEHHEQTKARALKKTYGIASKCNLREAFVSILTLDTGNLIEVQLLNIGNKYNKVIFNSFMYSKDLTDLPHKIYYRGDSDDEKEYNAYVEVIMEFGAKYSDHMNLFARAYLINPDAIFTLRKILRVRNLTSPSGWVGETSEGGDG